MITIKEIRAQYRAHHTSRARRYISRKVEGVVEEYKGRFGIGYKVYAPAWDSTTYCFVTYYVKREEC